MTVVYPGLTVLASNHPAILVIFQLAASGFTIMFAMRLCLGLGFAIDNQSLASNMAATIKTASMSPARHLAGIISVGAAQGFPFYSRSRTGITS